MSIALVDVWEVVTGVVSPPILRAFDSPAWDVYLGQHFEDARDEAEVLHPEWTAQQWRDEAVARIAEEWVAACD